MIPHLRTAGESFSNFQARGDVRRPRLMAEGMQHAAGSSGLLDWSSAFLSVLFGRRGRDTTFLASISLSVFVLVRARLRTPFLFPDWIGLDWTGLEEDGIGSVQEDRDRGSGSHKMPFKSLQQDINRECFLWSNAIQHNH